MEPKKKVIIVTGASSGIGSATGELLGKMGYSVFLCARSESSLTAIVRKINEQGGHAAYLACDLLDGDTPKRIVEECLQWAGSIDGVISNAGGARFTFFTKLTEQQFNDAIRLNLQAPIELIRAAIPHLLEQEKSHVVFVNTIAAREPAPPRGTSYVAAKAGLLHYAESLFAEVRDQGVRVTSILPDLTDTPLVPDELGVDKSRLIQPGSVAQVIANVLESPDDLCQTEIHLRPQLSIIRS